MKNIVKRILIGVLAFSFTFNLTNTVKANTIQTTLTTVANYVADATRKDTYLKTKTGKIVINSNFINKFMVDDKVSKKLVTDYVNRNFWTIKPEYVFNTFNNKKVKVTRIVQGLSYNKVKSELANNLYKAVTNKKFGNISKVNLNNVLNKTYIEVSLKDQTMSQVIKGKRIVTTNIVTGDVKKKAQTVKGLFTVIFMKKNRVLNYRDFDNTLKSDFVERWMRFDDANSIGIHDAPWRKTKDDWSSSAYKNGHGSHGCVNTPTKAVKTIYDNSYYGMPVLVY